MNGPLGHTMLTDVVVYQLRAIISTPALGQQLRNDVEHVRLKAYQLNLQLSLGQSSI